MCDAFVSDVTESGRIDGYDWAVTMGADFRRAWDECPLGVWLLRLAIHMGAGSREIDPIMLDAYGGLEGMRRVADAVQRAVDAQSGRFDGRACIDGAIDANVDAVAWDRRIAELLRARLSVDELIARMEAADGDD